MIRALLATTIGKWIAGALLVAALAYGPAMYAKGRLDCSASWRATIAAERLAWAARVDAARVTADEQRAVDDAEIADLDARIKELQDALSDPDRDCFGSDDTNRLRSLWPK